MVNSFKLIANLLERHGCDILLFIFDGGRVWRTEVHKANAHSWIGDRSRLGYKGGRALHQNEDYATIKHYIEVFRKYVLTRLKIPNIAIPQVEADDVIFWVSKNLVGVNKLIISADEDLIQCCKFPNTAWFTPVKNQYVTEDNFHHYNGYNLTDYLKLKAIVGDSSDNIEGIYGLAAGTLTKWALRSNVFPFDVFNWLENFGTQEERKKFHTPRHIQNYKVSLQLIDSEEFAKTWEGLDKARFYAAMKYSSPVTYEDIYTIVSSTGLKIITPSKLHGLADTLSKCAHTVEYLRRTIWK